MSHVHQVLSKVKENQLYVKGEKCEFHATAVAFLGNIISEYGVAMDECKSKSSERMADTHSK